MSYPNRTTTERPRRGSASIAYTTLVATLLATLALTIPRSVEAQDEHPKKSSGVNAGITVSDQASAKEVGLPLYPGAKLHKDANDDSAAANLGLWGGSFGFKLVVLKLESPDAPDKVAAFYRKALAKYGPVLDCSNPSAGKSPDETQDKNKSARLTCGDDKPDAGAQLFKSGSREKQHIVNVAHAGTGSNFQLVYLEARGGDKDAL